MGGGASGPDTLSGGGPSGVGPRGSTSNISGGSACHLPAEVVPAEVVPAEAVRRGKCGAARLRRVPSLGSATNGALLRGFRQDGSGKPLVFRDSMIENIRDLVDVVPRLNIFGDDDLARLCEQVKERIAGVEPDALRPSKSFDPVARARVKRDADELMEKFAGYFGTPPEPAREAA